MPLLVLLRVPLQVPLPVPLPVPLLVPRLVVPLLVPPPSRRRPLRSNLICLYQGMQVVAKPVEIKFSVPSFSVLIQLAL